jgi:hypothetical protein
MFLRAVMIKHIVLWKLKDFAEDADKAENIEKMKTMLETLPGKVPVIRSFEVGVNTIPSGASWDVVLIAGFDSPEDLETYQTHPEHLKVGEFIGKVRTDRALVDFSA